MLLIRMGWLTPPLRLSLIKAIIKWAGRLLNYSQKDIDAKLTSSYLTPEFLDSIVKCRSPRKSNGRSYQRGDLVTNIFGQFERLQLDPETLHDFSDYVRQWERVPGQRMLQGATYSIRAAIEHGREDSIGFYKCSGCDSEPQLRAFGAVHEPSKGGSRCGYWEMIVNANNERIVAVVPGYCADCSARGLLQHKHECIGGTVRILQRMQPTLNFNPQGNRNVMTVMFDSSGVMEKTWPGGPGRSINVLATELHRIAKHLSDKGNVTALQDWMVTSSGGNTRVVSNTVFYKRMTDIIIGKDGIEDGSFEIDGKMYSGVPIELPVGHRGLSAPAFRSAVWTKTLYAQYFHSE